FVGTANQAGVGQKLADLGKTADVVDLVQQDEGQDLADAGHRTQTMEGLRIVYLGGACQVQLDGADLLVVGVDQGQVEFDVLADAGILEACRQIQFGAVGGVSQLLGEGREVVLTVGVGQMHEGLGAATDEEGAAAQQVGRFA